MIIIITSKLDPHSDAVIDELRNHDSSVFRINTDNLHKEYSFHFDLHDNYFHVYDKWGRSADLLDNDIVIYYRKPEPVAPHPDVDSEGGKEYSKNETKELLNSLYAIDDIKWVNNPHITRVSQPNIPQLILADKIGLKTPRTIVTTDPERGKRFLESIDYRGIVKSLITTSVKIHGEPRHMYTTSIQSLNVKDRIDQIKLAPTLMQMEISKDIELRSTLIGNQLFTCAIDSQSVEDASTDWRVVDPFDLDHNEHQLPSGLRKKLKAFASHYDLSFATFDLIRTPEGEHIFLECNPNGQWYWIEMMTDMPMAAAMAEHLLNLSAA